MPADQILIGRPPLQVESLVSAGTQGSGLIFPRRLRPMSGIGQGIPQLQPHLPGRGLLQGPQLQRQPVQAGSANEGQCFRCLVRSQRIVMTCLLGILCPAKVDG